METEKTREELEQELAQCKADNSTKSEFLSMVVHQLRTPLSGIKWTFKMLLDGDLGSFSDEQRRVIEKGSESNERMIKLLNEVIVANQSGSWDFTYDMCNVDICSTVSNLVQEYSEQARVHNVHLTMNPSSSPCSHVNADPDKIAIVFQNLLENAIKYSHAEGTVTVTVEHNDSMVTISIHDTGIGIPTEDHEHIFEKFFRAQNVKDLKKEGTGLGLFTAKRIVEKHGGTLTFDSSTGKGTTFYVQLPLHNIS